ncbi:hypothetical protein [Deinococcus budaensis]|uniref:Bacterial Pleckstrin homology domain-containing protein n=1 Tax=Deinococcus budaensis TaxID=1665626 RepID=A0A7W8LPE9_9DEIO|nr:hypothetical protein [Deinococcus budaensis]MBB5233465.1 hypothetical protein [Deinococcus budaensis]
MNRLTFRNDGLGWFYLGLCILVLGALYFSGSANSQDTVTALSVLGVLALPLGLLSRLTVAVGSERLSVWLGPGLLRRNYPTREIVGIARADLPFTPFTVGLRLTPRGWLYSIGGREFTEVLFADGSHLLIGTDNAAQTEDFLRGSLS